MLLYGYAGNDPINGIDPDGLDVLQAYQALTRTGGRLASEFYDLSILGVANFISRVGRDLQDDPWTTSYKLANVFPQTSMEAKLAATIGVGTTQLLRSASSLVKTDASYVNLASPQRTIHILTGDAKGGGHLFPGLPGKSSFPSSWSAGRIMHEISDVATDPLSKVVLGRGGRTTATGTRDGIDIKVILGNPRENGEIITGFPTNVPRNP